MESQESEHDATEDQPRSRRRFLKGAVALSSFLVIGAIATVLKSITNPVSQELSTTGQLTFPRLRVAQLSDLQVGQPVVFNYPLDNEPNILVKLGVKAEGGIGPDQDIVAFSSVCQHLGCIYEFQAGGSSPTCNPSYKPEGPVGYCCCHGSVYDLTKGAQVISGPSSRPQPQVILELDSTGDIYAVGMGPPTIFGHDTGSNNVSADLQGGVPVG